MAVWDKYPQRIVAHIIGGTMAYTTVHGHARHCKFRRYPKSSYKSDNIKETLVWTRFSAVFQIGFQDGYELDDEEFFWSTISFKSPFTKVSSFFKTSVTGVR